MRSKRLPRRRASDVLCGRSRLGLAGRVQANQLQRVGWLDTADRTRTVGRGKDLAVAVHDEFRWLHDIAARVPPSANLVGNVARDTVGDRESDLARHFLRLVERIDAGRDDRRSGGIEFALGLREASQLPAAECSPVTAIEQDDPIAAAKISWDGQRPSVGERKRESWEDLAGIELACHDRRPLFRPRLRPLRGHEFVDPDRGADLGRRRRLFVLERDAGRVCHAIDAVEQRRHRRRVDQRRSTERPHQIDARRREPRVVADDDRLGEFDQQGALGYARIGRPCAGGNRLVLVSLAVTFAARTEPVDMTRGSISTLVEGRHTGGDQFDLRPADRAVFAAEIDHHPAAEILRVDHVEPRARLVRHQRHR